MTRLRDLDSRVHRIQVGFAFSALGSGLTLPFLFVYLAEVRDLPTATVGWLFAWMGLLGFLISPPIGSLIDRFGPRAVMLVALVIEAVATAALGWVDSATMAVIVLAGIVLGTTAMWPASTALLTRLVSEKDRPTVYGFNFVTLNAGLGIGGLVSSLIIDVDVASSFQRLYLLDGATFLIYVAVLLTLPRDTGRIEPAVSDTAASVEGWRTVLADRTMLGLLLVALLTLTFGYAQISAGLPAYAVEVAGIPAHTLGWAFGLNTAAIVVGQLFMIRLTAGRRRSLMLAIASTVWSLSWLVIAASDLVPGWWAVAAVVVGLGLFGLGETLWAPVAPALVNDLAPEHLRGRYNALLGMTWTTSQVLGPAIAGLLIGHGQADVWVVLVVGGTALSAVAFLAIGRRLAPQADGVVTDSDHAQNQHDRADR